MERYCHNCKHYDMPLSEYPCHECDTKWSKWEPIAETKEDDMGEKNTANTYTITFTPDQINKEALEDLTGMTINDDDSDEENGVELQLKAALEENERLKGEVHDAQIAVAKYVGMVEGLKYGIASIVTMMGGDQDGQTD